MGLAATCSFALGQSAGATPKLIVTRTVPSSGEPIPVIGMGTWITFNVGKDASLRLARCEVLETFFRMGGVMVDSSPMYGAAEEVVGACASKLTVPEDYLPTTKVWTSSRDQGIEQIRDSFRLWQVDRFGVFQVHNLVAWKTHLPYLQELKRQGKIRYVGVTTSHGRRHDEIAEVMRTQSLDFVQLTYNLQDREAEKRLLPMARDLGIGVIVNRPFRRGALFERLRTRTLPVWAKEFDCDNLAQFMLKFVVSHPAVTCAIPATSQVSHMIENMGAQTGRLPDSETRKRMIEWFEAS